MRVQCFEIGKQSEARRVELSEVLPRHREGSTLWVDVEVESRSEPAGLLADLGIAAEWIDIFLQPVHAARTIPFDGGVFFELPLGITGQPAELQSAAFVYLDRVVVSLHGRSDGPKGWIDLTRTAQLDLGDGDATTLLCALLVELSVQHRRKTLEVRRVLTELADRLDVNLDAVSSEEVARVKRRIVDLDAISEEREAALESLRDLARCFHDSTDFAGRLGIALGNTSSTARRLDRLDRRADAIQGRLDAVAQEKLNRRLGRLTIISAIFLPLTLISGVYGMNFEVMPELENPYAYPIVLGGMILVALGLLTWFRKAGWMD